MIGRRLGPCDCCSTWGWVYYMWGPWGKGFLCDRCCQEQQKEINSILRSMF